MVELADIGRQTQAPTPVRIKSVSIEGFRSLRCIQNLALPPLAVLIGANGAGKSTLLRFFDMLGWMLKDRRLQEFVLRQGGGDDQFFMGARQTPRIRAELCLEAPSGLYGYRFDLAHVAGGDSVILMNEAYRDAPSAAQAEVEWTPIGAASKESCLWDRQERAAKTIRGLLQQCVVYQFHDTSPNSAIHRRWDITDAVRLRPDGGNLAAVLLDLRHADSQRYALIVRQIRRVLPAFQNFVLEEQAGKVLLRWQGAQSDKVFGSHLTSDGSLRVFCLLTLLNLPSARLPDVMLFDEPELGLHPHAITLVAEMFKRLSQKRQILIATQSPYLVDCFELENIIIASASHGETRLRTLPREQYQAWLDDEYQLSDLWLQQATGGVAWLGDTQPVQREGVAEAGRGE